MILTIISTILGILSSSIPTIMNYLQKKRQYDYELELTRLKVEAAKNGYQLTKETEQIKSEIATTEAIVNEGNNIRDNDSKLTGGSFVDTLRVSVRPIITYTLFGMFVFVKFFVAATVLMSSTLTVETIKMTLDSILDTYTLAMTSTVIGYYFGAKSFESISESIASNKVTPATKTIVINKK
jgi:hypothetical protein